MLHEVVSPTNILQTSKSDLRNDSTKLSARS